MLLRFALRTAAVMALRGRTLVGDNVHDSRIGAIDITASGALRIDDVEAGPFANVYTDAATFKPERSVNSLWDNGEVTFVIESGIAQPMFKFSEDAGESALPVASGLEVPATDDAFEFVLDLLDRQVAAALMDSANAWAELWRRLHNGIVRVERPRVARSDERVRRAARALRVTVAGKTDPVPGAPMDAGSVWERARTLIAADLPSHIELFDALYAAPPLTGSPTLAHIRSRHGLTAGSAKALRVVPVAPGTESVAIASMVVTEGGTP